MQPNPLYSDTGSGVFCIHPSDKSFNLIQAHAHVQYEFLFLVQGSILVENSKQIVKATPPCAIIHCPYTLHRAQTADDHTGVYERYVINFRESLLSDFFEYIEISRLKGFGMTVIPLPEKTADFLIGCCEQIIDANERGEHKRSVLILATIADTLIKCMPRAEAINSPFKIMYIYNVMEYITENLQLNPKLEELAERFFVSRAKLASDFKTVTGMSIKKYTTFMKLNLAKIMLKKGYSVSETAEACGFSDDSHFIITFKSHTNMTPKEYARKGDYMHG